MKLDNLIPGVSQAKLLIALVAFAVPSIGWGITAHTLHGVRAWQSNVVAVTSTAAHTVDGKGRPALLAAKDVPAQIKILGDGLDAVVRATATAKSNNAANNTRIEAAQVAITQETGDAIEQRIVAARAAGAADYARRVRGQSACPTYRGDAGKTRAAEAGDTPGDSDGAGGVPVMDADDVRICSDNTVKALGWQNFNRRVTAIPR